ncbi:hypothetical protein D3C85_995910 [compost metagenome]
MHRRVFVGGYAGTLALRGAIRALRYRKGFDRQGVLWLGGIKRQCLFLVQRFGGQRGGVGGEADGGVDVRGGGIQHDEAMAAAGVSATSSAGTWAGRSGFEFLGRVDASLDRLLQLRHLIGGSLGGRLGGWGICRGNGVGFAPLAVATQVDGAAIGQFQGRHAFIAGQQLVPLEEAVAFHDQALESLRRHGVDLANNAFDDRNNTAHGATLLELLSAGLPSLGSLLSTTKRRTDIPFYI